MVLAHLTEFLGYHIVAFGVAERSARTESERIALHEFRVAFDGVMLSLERRPITYGEVVQHLRAFRTLYEVYRGYLAALHEVSIEGLEKVPGHAGLGRFDIPKSVGRFLGDHALGEADKPAAVSVDEPIARLILDGKVAGICDFACEEVAGGYRLVLLSGKDFCERPAPIPEHALARGYALACQIVRQSEEYAAFRKSCADGTRARIQEALASGDAEWVTRARADHRNAMESYYRAAGKC